jgi:hypothetical protein
VDLVQAYWAFMLILGLALLLIILKAKRRKG